MIRAYSGWLKAREERDTCPWSGPVPLEPDGPFPLVGRKQDREALVDAVRDHSLVILAGESGVGKSSLINDGMLPDLERSGHTTVVCRSWVDDREGPEASRFLASKVAQSVADDPDLAAVIASPVEPGTVFERLDEAFGREVVVFLDQFEELIRYAPSVARATIDEILDINSRMGIRVVVSLRSEHLHQIRRLEKGARPFTVTFYELGPVTDPDAVERLIVAPNKAGSTTRITTRSDDEARLEAADELRSCWEAMLASNDDEAAAIGLLHLNALLYALWFQGGGCVTIDHLAQFRAVRGLPAFDAEDPARWRIFLAALPAAIDVKLVHCEEAARDVGLDSYLIQGTRRALANAVSHLSSAGFKVPRRVDDLARASLAEDLRVLLPAMRTAGSGPTVEGPRRHDEDGDLDDDQLEALIRELVGAIDAGEALGEPTSSGPVDLTAATRADLARRADERHAQAGHRAQRTWTDRLHPGLPPWLANGAGASCGPLMGQAPANALIEEVRRFAFALAWLSETQLVRFTSPGRAGRMVLLIHDGFGTALREWAKAPLGSIGAALSAITAPSGAVFAWPQSEESVFPPEFDGIDAPRVIPNLRWRGAWIESSFRHVVFVNCDFRGSYFHYCTFDGVVFMNCLLDGVIFSDCTITGSAESVPPRKEGWDKKDEATFLVPADDTLLAELGAYQGVEIAEALYSPKPGEPAKVGPTPQEKNESDPWTMEKDGLVVYGGRVSSLVFRSCSSGPIALRHVAGSGLEIVEQRGGSLEINGSVLRHISITSEAGVLGPSGHDDTPADFRISIRGSFVAQMWLGDDLHGTLTASDSTLAQVFNRSDLRASVVAADDQRKPSMVFQLVGFERVEAVDIDAEREPGALEDLARNARQMDYRRDPALAEAREQAAHQKNDGSTAES